MFTIQGKELELNNNPDFIDLSSYNSGVYIIKIISDKGSLIKKLIKD